MTRQAVIARSAGPARGGVAPPRLAPARLSVLLVGDISRAEFREARDLLAGAADLAEAPDAAAAVRRLGAGEAAPHLLVLAQARPGQFSAAEVDRLLRLAPLARVIGLLGSWCEGETRTGKPWPASQRVYWHQWNARLRDNLERLLAGACPEWGLPLSASEEEKLEMLLHGSGQGERPPPGGVVAVCSALAESAEWLAAACRAYGHVPLLVSPQGTARLRGAAAALWDDAGQPHDALSLARLAAAVAPAPVVALVGFPREEHCRQLAAAGASAVFSKPLRVSELFAELRRLSA